MGIFPARLRGAAGPAPGSDSHRPASDRQLTSTSIPESNTVEYFYSSSFLFIDLTKYQDPLTVLLGYIAEVSISFLYASLILTKVQKELDSDMLLIHDDDLGCIGEEVCLFIHKLIVPSMFALAGARFPPA